MKRVPGRMALLLAAMAASSCAEIRLRDAMDVVQLRHHRLQEKLRAGKSFESRDAAMELKRALEAPAVSERSPFAGNAEYERLLKEAIATAERVRQAAQRFEPGALDGLTSEVNAACDACHSTFRKT